MTPDEIINEIWQLSWYEVLKIAVMDDFILAAKIWPVWVLIIGAGLVVAYLSKKTPEDDQ